MSLIGKAHEKYVLRRRFDVLGGSIERLLPTGASVLDVGCGSGDIDSLILGKRSDLSIQGIDVLVRGETAIEVMEYDGSRFPFDDGSFDAVMFVDVLHHTENIEDLLKEAARVTRRHVIIKDHTREGFLAEARLRLMDRVGNERFGVRCIYNYWTRDRWIEAFMAAGLSVEVFEPRLNLYAWPLSVLFDSSLHFIARLTTQGRASHSA